MKKAKVYLERISRRMELPAAVTAGLPLTTVNGFGEISIDLQQGLLAFSDTEIIVAVSQGQIVVTGAGLHIRLMKEGRITIVGDIDKVTFVRSEKP